LRALAPSLPRPGALSIFNGQVVRLRRSRRTLFWFHRSPVARTRDSSSRRAIICRAVLDGARGLGAGLLAHGAPGHDEPAVSPLQSARAALCPVYGARRCAHWFEIPARVNFQISIRSWERGAARRFAHQQSARIFCPSAQPARLIDSAFRGPGRPGNAAPMRSRSAVLRARPSCKRAGLPDPSDRRALEERARTSFPPAIDRLCPLAARRLLRRIRNLLLCSVLALPEPACLSFRSSRSY